ncbi:MAG: hypothetical protein WA418_29350 [Bradyrhizobium sp.]
MTTVPVTEIAMTLWEQCFLRPLLAATHRYCPNCGAMMRLVRLDPAGPGADVLSFACACHHTASEAVRRKG